jgi:hypothetical protein
MATRHDSDQLNVGEAIQERRREYVVGVIFNNIVVDAGAFGAALGSGLNINFRHDHIS